MRKVLLCIAFFISWSFCSYGQGAKQDTPPIRLGNLDTANITCEDLLKNTGLVAADRSWVVTKFTISFILPDGKTYGPFPTIGSELSEQAIKTIKRLKKTKCEISIVEISVAHNGKEKFAYPITLRYNK